MKFTEEDFIKKNQDATTDISSSPNPSRADDDSFAADPLLMYDMTFKEKQKYKKDLLFKRLATMEKSEKRKYIIHYYKYHFLVILLAIFCVYGVAHKIYIACLPTELTLMIANEYDISPSDYITDSFRNYYNLDTKNKIMVGTGYAIQDTDIVGTEESISRQQLYASIKDNDLDALIGNQACLNFVSNDEDIVPLDEALDSHLYEQLKNYIVTATDQTKVINNGEPFPAALNIADTEFAQKCGFTNKEIYLMIPINRSTENEKTIRLIKMIFNK